MKLNDLIFEDCIIVGFSRDAARQSLALTFEARSQAGSMHAPELYILECSEVSDVQLRFNGEFPEDLNRPYDTSGQDQRANEIHELRREANGYMHVRADMLHGKFYCKKYRLLRIVDALVEV